MLVIMRAPSSDRTCSVVLRPGKAWEWEGLCAAVSSPLAVHQVFLGGPHGAAGLSKRQIARSSATCANIPFRFRLCISSLGGSGSQGGIQESSACSRPVLQSKGRRFLRLTNVDAVLSRITLQRLIYQGLPVRGTRGTVARRHSWGQVLEGDLPPPPGVLTAERPVPDDTSQARPGKARPRGAACRLTSRWSATRSLLHRT